MAYWKIPEGQLYGQGDVQVLDFRGIVQGRVLVLVIQGWSTGTTLQV